MTHFPGDPRSRPARGTGDVLVTGATGLLGRAVCRELGRRKIHHRALVRPTSARAVLEGSGAYTWMIEGDLLRPESLATAAEGVATVLHLAGLVRSGDAEACRALHVGGTEALLAASPGARVVAMSSDTVLRAHRGGYAQSKAKMEAVLARAAQGGAREREVDAARAGGREVVVLRPPMMLGPGSPHLATLERAARMPVVPLPDGFARRAPVHVEDVAGAVVAAMGLPRERWGDGALVLDLPGSEEASFGEVVAALAEARGWRPPRVVEVPAPLSSGAIRMLGRLGARGARVRRRVEGMQQGVTADGARARELLGWDPRPLREVLR